MNSVKDALIAYAKMMNTLDSTEFESLLEDNFSYESQTVIEPINGKKEFIEYIRPKLRAIKISNAVIFAELAELNAYGQKDCVLIAQNDKNNLVATVYAKVNGSKIIRLDMCTVPDPKSALRTGIYPT
jgi:hypothetical protein